ncbi:E3 ubiquitin-protein ligase TRAIP-like [Spea bombifrons]|uniref:E3 ubiquitin-protein ligase TRAIP-like n=1 Tax=Spea bombifrons TaxID=233779 RepID=UPI002349A44A|nr:E3 ubiquitin-protein ligase TRAIP-like [Spea bombifrons]
MPIWAYCGICISPLDDTSNVAAICCGHTFHQECLLQWFRSSPRPTCPQCRTQLGSSQDVIKKLFFDIREQEGPTLNEELLKKEVERLNALILLKEEKQKQSYDKACAAHDLRQKKNTRMEDLQKHLRELKTLYSRQEEQLKILEQQLLENKVAIEEAGTLKKRLTTLENVEMLQTQRPDMETAIRGMASAPDALEQLAVYYVSAAKECNHLMDAQTKSAEMTMNLKRELEASNYRAQKTMHEIQRSQEALNNTQMELSAMQKKKKVQLHHKTSQSAPSEATGRLPFTIPARVGFQLPKLRSPRHGARYGP